MPPRAPSTLTIVSARRVLRFTPRAPAVTVSNPAYCAIQWPSVLQRALRAKKRLKSGPVLVKPQSPVRCALLHIALSVWNKRFAGVIYTVIGILAGVAVVVAVSVACY